MFTKENILPIAQKAGYSDEFIKQIEEYLDYVSQNTVLLTALEKYYNTLFIDEDIFPITKVRNIPLPQKQEEKYKGFFELIIYLVASQHFERYITENGFDNCKYDLADTYYKNIRRFSEMNYIRDNTYALIRHGYFLYGYAKPFILHIGRLSYELRLYDNSLYEIYENENGERIFINSQEPNPKGFKKIIENGDPYVTIHIPGVGKLDEQEVIDSIKTATPILKKAFKKYNPKHFLCTSWLISPQLTPFLKESSNIRRFSNFFDTALGNDAENALYEHIFKCPVCPIEQLTAENAFQENILSIYKKGDKLCNGIGILKKEFCKL